jgi:membrane-associated phospholipid phosphatase
VPITKCEATSAVNGPVLALSARVKTQLLAGVLVATLAFDAGAQATTRPPLFTANDAYWGAAFLLGSVALTRVDAHITQALMDSSVHANLSRDALANNLGKIQEGTLFFGNLALWGVGRVTHQSGLADIAFHATEAVTVGTIVSQVIRGPLGRSRPFVSNNKDPYDFHPFQGFTQKKYRSFPSIHTEAAFSVATVYTLEMKRRHPGSQWIVGPIAYALAAGPGLARLYNGQHWASDILSGAFVGTFVGAKVVRYNHSVNPGNRTDRFFLGARNVQFSAGPKGVAVLYALNF